MCSYYDDPDFAEEYRRRDEEAEAAYVEEQEREDLRKVRACPGTRFPDGTHCGEYGWHAKDCPMRAVRSAETDDLIANLRAVLRLISPEHITPMGVRQIEQVLNAHGRG
jgi:hypothetical protein